MLLAEVGHRLAPNRRLGGEVGPPPLGHHELIPPDVPLYHLVAHLPLLALNEPVGLRLHPEGLGRRLLKLLPLALQRALEVHMQPVEVGHVLGDARV